MMYCMCGIGHFVDPLWCGVRCRPLTKEFVGMLGCNSSIFAEGKFGKCYFLEWYLARSCYCG